MVLNYSAEVLQALAHPVENVAAGHRVGNHCGRGNGVAR